MLPIWMYSPNIRLVSRSKFGIYRIQSRNSFIYKAYHGNFWRCCTSYELLFVGNVPWTEITGKRLCSLFLAGVASSGDSTPQFPVCIPLLHFISSPRLSALRISPSPSDCPLLWTIVLLDPSTRPVQSQLFYIIEGQSRRRCVSAVCLGKQM